MPSDYCFANLTLALLNWLEVVAIFLELVVVAEWFGLLETEGRTTAKAAMMFVLGETAELGSGLAEDPLVVVARCFDGIDLALRWQ
jgi:hypothetical protein